MQNKEMFTGLRVLELASVLAGPSVGQFFAELGAEVIKVENPATGGDVTRSWKSAGEKTDDRSAYFCSCNWGKKSVTLDLSMQGNLQRVHQLVRNSDLVVASYKPGDAEKLGVSYSQLKSINSKLIYGQITGYGSDDDRVGYDAVIQAESGFMDLNGDPAGPPTKMPVALIDVLAAHQLKEALLLALLHRERTGEGAFVEVSLIQAAVASLTNQATNWLVAGQLPKRQGSAHPNIAPYGDVFETKDGKRLLLAVGNDRQFTDLLDALRVAPEARAPHFATNQQRVQHRAELTVVLRQYLSQLSADDVIADLRARKIPAGLVQNVREALELSEARSVLLDAGGLRAARQLVADLSFAESRSSLTPPPHLGEHNDVVFPAS
jgi:crotonobetainyl-CoA:carnitine CoA-transferase CaiB-like acyl-CoA transferase